SATALENDRATATLLSRLAAPQQGQYASWQFAALAGWLDALEQRNTPLTRLQQEGSAELRAGLRPLGRLFESARAAVKNHRAPAKQLLAVRLLGRGLDKQTEDLAVLADLLVPQTASDLQAGAIAALGQLRDPRIPEVLLRGWKGYGPELRSQVLDFLFRRE